MVIFLIVQVFLLSNQHVSHPKPKTVQVTRMLKVQFVGFSGILW